MGAIRCALCAQRVLCSYTPLLARYASTTPRVTPSPSTKTSTRAPPPVAPKRSIPSGPKAETRPKQSSKVVSPRVPPAPRPSSSKNSAPAPSFPLPPPSARKTGPKSTVRKATTRKAAPTAQSNEPVLPEQSSKEAEDDDIENRSFVESVRRLTPNHWYLIGGLLALGAGAVWAMDKFALADRDKELSTILDRAPNVERRAS